MSKNILVIGAGSGIGAKTAEYLSEIGMKVILVSRDNSKLEKVKSCMKNAAEIFPYDLQDLEHIEEIFRFCLDNKIILDGMVYSAGINWDMPIRTNDIEVMKEVITINYMAFVETMKYFSKKIYSAKGSSIVAISSNATRSIAAGMSIYTSSKAALESAVQVGAKELVKRRIRVNAILPACVDTQMVENAPFLSEESIKRSQPIGLIEPQYIAYLIEFLLSDKAKYITGSLIPVTAGA